MESFIEYDTSINIQIDESLPICVNNAGHYYITSFLAPTQRPVGRVDYQIIYVAQGSMDVLYDRKTRTVTAGNVVLFKPHEPQIYQYNYNNPPCEVYWVHFYGPLVASAFRDLGLENVRVLEVGNNFKIPQLIEEMIEALISQQSGHYYSNSGNLFILLSELANIKQRAQTDNNASSHFKFREVLLQMHNLKANFSLKEFAEMSNMSPSRFSHLFKETFGRSPYSYYLNIRMNHAKSLLTNTSLSMSEIATYLGYDDVFYFSRLFKKFTGLSPSYFRKNEGISPPKQSSDINE